MKLYVKLACPDYLLDSTVEACGEALWFCGAFDEHPGYLTGLGLAGYLERKDHRLRIFEPQFLRDGQPDQGDFAAGLGGDLTARGLRVELLADLDTAPQAPLPPPRGTYARKALMHQSRRAVGEKLV